MGVVGLALQGLALVRLAWASSAHQARGEDGQFVDLIPHLTSTSSLRTEQHKPLPSSGQTGPFNRLNNLLAGKNGQGGSLKLTPPDENLLATYTQAKDQRTSIDVVNEAEDERRKLQAGSVRINCGGSSYTDPLGNVWQADNSFSGGSVSGTSTAIADTAIQPIYQSDRYCSSNCRYNIPVPNGKYLVRLHLAEVYFYAPNKRVFSIKVQGATVVSNVDLYATAGANRPVVRSYVATVSTGILTVQLIKSVQNPKISGIEVIPQVSGRNQGPSVTAGSGSQSVMLGSSVSLVGYASDDGLPSPPASLSYQWSMVSGLGIVTFSAPTNLITQASFSAAGTYVLGVTASDGALSASSTTTITAKGSAQPTVATRINCGGPAFTDPTGNVWGADRDFTGGAVFATSTAVLGTPGLSTIYQTERSGAFTYSLALPPGSYVVNLHFAEIYFSSASQRIFSMSVQGIPVVSNLDIYARVGSGPLVVSANANVGTNQQLSITTAAVKEKPKLSAIEVYALNSGVGAWEKAASMPIALGEVAAGVVNGVMYVVGEGNSATLAYDFHTGTWASNLATRPYPGNHHMAEVINSQFYLFGGLSSSSSGKVQIYDPAVNTWSFGAGCPVVSGSANTAVINGKVYYAGGISGSVTVADAAVYTPATNSWAPIAPMPAGRNHAASATDGQKLYVFGGRTGGNVPGVGFSDVQIYDPRTNTWAWSGASGSTLAPLPQQRGGMGKAVYFRGEFYVLGGETTTNTVPNNVYNRVDVYNPTTNTWRLEASMPTARHGIFPTVYQDRIHVAGGGIKASKSQSAVVEVFHR